ncbi:MAG: hypothetical protein JXQ87_16060 [Bacteroidia bacterium]
MPNIDDIFRAGLANHEMAPGASGWDKLSKQLTSKEGKVVLPWYYNPKKAMLGALLISLMSFTVGYFIAQAYISDNNSNASTIVNLPLGTEKEKGEKKEQPLHYNAQNKQFASILLKVKNENPKESSNTLTASIDSWQEIEHFSAVASSASEDFIERTSELVQVDNDELGLKLSPINRITTKALALDQGFISLNSTTKGFHHKVELSKTLFSSNQSSYSSLKERATTDAWTGEESVFASVNHEFRFSRKLGRNFTIVSGVGFDFSNLSVSGSQIIYDKDTVSLNLENRDEISKLDYSRSYQATIAYAPLGIRFEGKYSRLGYRLEVGGFVQKTLSQRRTFSLSDESFLPLANEWAHTVFDQTPRLGFYSALGFEAYLTQNIGVSFEAVIRKRMQPLISARGFDNVLTQHGARLGLFYSF